MYYPINKGSDKSRRAHHRDRNHKKQVRKESILSPMQKQQIDQENKDKMLIHEKLIAVERTKTTLEKKIL